MGTCFAKCWKLEYWNPDPTFQIITDPDHVPDRLQKWNKQLSDELFYNSKKRAAARLLTFSS
jgi:hypothetical protein